MNRHRNRKHSLTRVKCDRSAREFSHGLQQTLRQMEERVKNRPQESKTLWQKFLSLFN